MKLEAQLADAKTVAISGHVRPDGDCAGSCLATYNYIKEYFPHIAVDLYLEEIPAVFSFLQRSEEILHESPEHEPYDLFIIQDCSDSSRLGDFEKYFMQAKRTFCIDHHVSNQEFADANYIFPKASSTAELVYELLDEDKITKQIAECIYVGMIHDSGVFQYSSTSAKTMNIAGKLMEMGINFSEIVDTTFYTKSFEQNRILGQALLNAKLLSDGKIITSAITKTEMEQFHVSPKQLDGIVNQLRITKGVEVAIFLYELEDGYKISMRSNGKADVARISMAFGGGGHVRAAGVSMKGTEEEILSKIVPMIEEQC